MRLADLPGEHRAPHATVASLVAALALCTAFAAYVAACTTAAAVAASGPVVPWLLEVR